MDAKGRNGDFVVARTETIVRDDPAEAVIHLFSRTVGKEAPARIVGRPQEVLQWLVDMINQITLLSKRTCATCQRDVILGETCACGTPCLK